MRCTLAWLAALICLAQLLLLEARDPTPNVQTSNLPKGICPKAGDYLMPDVTDNTSYYVCCGNKKTTVRKTCMYEVIGGGQYDALTAAPYDSRQGRCVSKPAMMTPGSFKSPNTTAPLSSIYKQAYRATPTVPNKEAAATCRSAASAPAGRAANNMTGKMKQAANTEAGEWRLIRDSQGVSSTGVLGINAVLLPASDKVLVWARLHPDGSKDNYQPRVIAEDGVPEVSAVYDTKTGTYVVKQVRSTPFCSGQTILPSGQILATGGDDLAQILEKSYTNGLKGIRLYNPPENGGWNGGSWVTLPDSLASPRWYPTQVLMPDGNRVVIAGGRASQRDSTNIATAEVYDHTQLKTVAEVPVQFLQGLGLGGAVFPTMYVLPFAPGKPGEVHMFMFSCDKAAIETLRPDNTWYQTAAIGGWPSRGYCGAFSSGGTATMLMLEPEADYAPEVVMFGGWKTGGYQCHCDNPTSDWAHRIKLDKATVDSRKFAWNREKMPHGRNLNDVVLLPNGKLVVVNGAKWGVVDNLRDAAYDAWMYDPKAPEGRRFTTMAAATVKRYYHSGALLLPDASVLTVGNEYGECSEACAAKTPYDFHHQAERFLPPYFFTGGRPVIRSMSTGVVKYGGIVTVGYRGTVTGAVLIAPGAVTHQVDMNQRGVRLEVVSNAGGRVTLKMPPNSYVMQPGYHMLFVMNDDKPCTRARWIKLV